LNPTTTEQELLQTEKGTELKNDGPRAAVRQGHDGV
jgi:hypothetical protein